MQEISVEGVKSDSIKFAESLVKDIVIKDIVGHDSTEMNKVLKTIYTTLVVITFFFLTSRSFTCINISIY